MTLFIDTNEVYCKVNLAIRICKAEDLSLIILCKQVTHFKLIVNNKHTLDTICRHRRACVFTSLDFVFQYFPGKANIKHSC